MKTLKTDKPKARKEHICDFCHEKIGIGETYNNQTNTYEGNLYTWKTHLNCSAIARELKMYDNSDEGVTSDDFWEHINNAFFSLPNNLLPVKPTPREKLDIVIQYFKRNKA